MERPDEMQSEGRPDERSSLGVGRALRNHWGLLLVLVLVGAAMGAVAGQLFPKEFDATASVLPPVDPRANTTLAALATQVGGVAPFGAMLQGAGTKDVFLGILKSRTMQDDIIKKFDLIKEYGFQDSKAPMQSARKKLQEMTNIRASREGVISVTVSAYDSQRAADVANFYVENLDRLNTALNVTDAGRSRLFLEGRVIEAQKALRESEDRLRAYQSRSKAVVMEGQAKAAIEGTAKLEGQILAAEVQLKTLETYSTALNPDVIKLRQGIEEMRRQLRRMEYGKEAAGSKQQAAGREQQAGGSGQPAAGREQQAGGSRQRAAGGRQEAENSGQRAAGGDGPAGGKAESRATGDEAAGPDFAMPLGQIPTAGAELARLIREAKIQETLYTLLMQQLEQAKIAEAKDTPTVRILDRAVPPEWKSRPSIRNNTITGAGLALLLGVLLAFGLDKRRSGTETGRGLNGSFLHP